MKPGRQRRGGVLHPPFAVGITFKSGDRRMRVEAHRAGWQDHSAKPLGPAGSFAFDAQIQRRLRTMRRGDGAGDGLAISRAPALGEPGGRIVVERIGTHQNGVAIASDGAQHRIGERGEWGAAGIGARCFHREIDRRMVGRIEKQNLRRSDDERPFQRAAAPWHAFFQSLRQRLADRAEPAQRDSGDRARQRPVARVKAASLLRQIGGEPLLERARQGQGFGDGARRGDSRRQSRRRRGRRFRTARMKPARLSRQTTLASNQNFRPPIWDYTRNLRQGCVRLVGANGERQKDRAQGHCKSSKPRRHDAGKGRSED